MFYKKIYFGIFSAESDRTKVVKKNIFFSFLIKGLGVAINFILVPLAINFLSNQKYGIWLTLFSVINWFNLMDVGLGNGFRNKFSESIALGDVELAKKYIQTLYSSTALVVLLLFIIFFVSFPFIEWKWVLNLPLDFDENINLICGIVISLFLLQIFFKNISTILLAYQKTALSNLLILFGNMLALVILIICSFFFKINLLILSSVFMISPVIIFVAATIILFKGTLSEFKCKFTLVPEKEYFFNLISIGFRFFLIQIATIFIFSSSNILISQLFTPAEVVPYNIAFQLFSSLQIVFTIILTPFWTAFNDAFIKNDEAWIKNSFKHLIKIWSIFSFVTFGFFFFAPIIFKIWVGEQIYISSLMTFLFALFSILISLSSIFSYFLAGIGKIKISIYVSILQSFINIPLALFFIKALNMDSSGIILSIDLTILLGIIIQIFQTYLIITKKANGVWAC